MGGKKISGTTAGIIIAVVVIVVAILAYKYIFTLNQSQTPSGKAFEDKMRSAHAGKAAYPTATGQGAAPQGAPTQ